MDTVKRIAAAFTALVALAFTVCPACGALASDKKADPNTPSAEILLGQSLIVGIPGTTIDEKTRDFLHTVKPAGIILYARNIATLGQTETLIAVLQEIALESTGLPYLIMIDEEPGGVTRLGFFKNVFSTGEPDWTAIDRDIKKMSSMGINVNLAPIADFPFEKDSFVRRRMAAKTTEVLKEFNSRFIAISQNYGVAATLKHFPGMGVFKTDPHIRLPHGAELKDALENSIEIFKDGIDSGAMFVLTGHAVYDDIDPTAPATLSRTVTTGLLRETLGFRGMIITDDLSDMPFTAGDKKPPFDTVVKRALMAGNNYVMFSHRPENTKKTVSRLLKIMEKNPELKNVLIENFRMSTDLKNKLVQAFKKSAGPRTPLNMQETK